MTGLLSIDLLRELTVAGHPRGQAHLSSASGLVCRDGRVWVVADDEQHLAVFDDRHAPGRLHRLRPGDLPHDKAARKRRKADLEVLLSLPGAPPWPHGALLALGSGSRPNREAGSLVTLDARGDVASVRALDLRRWYAPLHDRIADLNIEGALLLGDRIVLLQRGHQARPLNAALHFDRDEVLALVAGEADAAPRLREQRNYALGEADGVPLCFTDATPLPDGRWLFTAVAEATDDPYLDGACGAAAVGLVDAAGRLEVVHRLAMPHKVEGIAARLRDGAIDLCLVTDADDPAVPSRLFTATL